MAQRRKGGIAIDPRSAQNMSTRRGGPKKRTAPSPAKVVGIIGAITAITVCLLVQLPGLDAAGTRMFGIFLAAILLWVTEAVPLAGGGGGGAGASCAALALWGRGMRVIARLRWGEPGARAPPSRVRTACSCGA